MFRIQTIAYYLMIVGTIMAIIVGLFFMFRSKIIGTINIFGMITIINAIFLGALEFEQDNFFATKFIALAIFVFLVDFAMIFHILSRTSFVMDKLKIVVEKLSVRK